MKAILFDFDGVVADTMKYHADSWVLAFQRHGMDLSAGVVYENEGAPFAVIIKTLFRNCEAAYDEKIAVEIIKTKEEIYKAYDHNNRIYPEVYEILTLAEKLGLKKGLVTGTSRQNLHQTIPEELLSRFEVVITADMVKKGKPFPDPYLKAASLLNVSPKDCTVIENAPLGIEAAKGAGCKCIGICTTLTRKHLSKADVIVANHRDLLAEFSIAS